MADKDGDKISAAIFKTLLGILSEPVALLGVMDFRVFKTDSRLTEHVCPKSLKTLKANQTTCR